MKLRCPLVSIAILLLLNQAHFAFAANSGDVVINEIMQNPSAVADLSGEWFELFNTTNEDINLDGWRIHDLGTDSHIINNGGALTIRARSFLVLGINATFSTNGSVKVDYQYSNFFLDDGADEVILQDVDLNEIDRVEYDGGPNFPDPTGASMAFTGFLTRGDAIYQNDFGDLWITSTSIIAPGGFGTPGAVNNLQLINEDTHVFNDLRDFSPSFANNVLFNQDRAAAFFMNNTVTADSVGIFASFGLATTLTASIREVTFDSLGNPILGGVITTASLPVVAGPAGFTDVPLNFTYIAGHVYDIAFNVTGGWGNPSSHTIDFYSFDNPTLNFASGFDAGAFRVLDGRGIGTYGNTFLPHVRLSVKTDAADLRPTFGGPQLRNDLGNQDRGIGVTATTTVHVSSIGILANIVSFTQLNLTIRELNGAVPGGILAATSLVTDPLGPTFYDVPIDFTFQANSSYHITFNVPGGWGATSIHQLEIFDFDNSTLNASLGYDSGGLLVLDGTGGVGGFSNTQIPHIRICVPPFGYHLNHPTTSPSFVTALGPQDRGVAMDVSHDVTVQSVGVFLNPPQTTDLTATIRRVTGTTLGPILSRETTRILPGGAKFYDVLIHATLEAGKRYDIAFNVTGGWGSAGAPSMHLYSPFTNPSLNPLSGFISGPFTVLAGRGSTSGYSVNQLPRTRICLLQPADDLQAQVTSAAFTNAIGNDDRGIAVQVSQTVKVHSLGIYMIAGQATTLTVNIRQVTGITLGSVLATASIPIVKSGPAFYDVPIEFTFQPIDSSNNALRYDIAFNITGGWGNPSQQQLELDSFNNSSLNPSFGYTVGPFLILDGRGFPGIYTNSVIPRIRAGYASPLELRLQQQADFKVNGTQSGQWIGGVTLGSATTSVNSSGLCMFAPALGSNVALWLSPEAYIELIDNTVYRFRVRASTTQTTADAIPLWNVVYDNFNSSGLGNTYGGMAWFLDVVGGANGIGRPQGRTVFDVYATPNPVLTQQWRGVIDNSQSAFSPAADAFNDMRIFLRILDGNASINSDFDSGTICIEKLEISAITLNAIELQSIVYNPKIGSATHFGETTAQGTYGSTPTMDNLHGTVRYALFSPTDDSTLGPFDPTQPNANTQLYPVLWEHNTLYRGRAKIRSDVGSGLGPEGIDPVDVIILAFDTTTSELGQFNFATRGTFGNMQRAASPRLRFTTSDEAQTYMMYFYSNNTTASTVPDANRLRFMTSFFNTTDLFGLSGLDPLVVEAIEVDKMKSPNLSN